MPDSEESLPTAELDELCRLIEREWCGVLAAYRGFPTGRLQPEDTDCVIEVFFVDETLEKSVIRGTYPERKKLRRERGCHVSIVCHDSAASLSHYVEDVMALYEHRFGGCRFASVDPLPSLAKGFADATGDVHGLASIMRYWDVVNMDPYQIGNELWKTEPELAA